MARRRSKDHHDQLALDFVSGSAAGAEKLPAIAAETDEPADSAKSWIPDDETSRP